MSRGVLAPIVQLYKITDRFYACVEHRKSPTTCFSFTAHKQPSDYACSSIKEYVALWKPILMMEMATSAVSDDDVIILWNLCVNFVKGTSVSVKK